jgi:hypothetical protein
MPEELVKIPTDALIDMLYIIAGDLATAANDAAEIRTNSTRVAT